MTTIGQLAGITSQHNEIVKRVVNGSLDPTAVKRALQNIIESKFIAPAWNPPAWWRTPQHQLERARQFWPGRELPVPPKDFTPQTKSEVLLLHVPDSFESLWDKVDDPMGYTKVRSSDVKSGKRKLRLAPNVPNRTEPAWLAIDLEHGKGERPDKFWGQSNLAASEVFSAAIQFPEWVSAWFYSAPAPSLSGYQLREDWGFSEWTDVPYLDRTDDVRELQLCRHYGASRNPFWASPSVREC